MKSGLVMHQTLHVLKMDQQLAQQPEPQWLQGAFCPLGQWPMIKMHLYLLAIYTVTCDAKMWLSLANILYRWHKNQLIAPVTQAKNTST